MLQARLAKAVPSVFIFLTSKAACFAVNVKTEKQTYFKLINTYLNLLTQTIKNFHTNTKIQQLLFLFN
jgi:hypothetical protein